MKENDIRVDDNLGYRWSLYKKDQQRLLNKKKAFVSVPCPACGQKDSSLFYKRTGFFFEKCSVCDTVYVNPRPTIEMLIDHYRNSLAEKYFNEHIYSKTEQGRVEHLLKPRLKKIYTFCQKYNTNYGTILDVGAGYGTLCEIAKKDGKFERVIGVEPNPSPANICRSKGIEVLEDFIENVQAKAIADVVTSIENIEHVFDPKTFLVSIYNILRKNGLLVITTPNIKGFDLLTLKDKSDNTTAPDHLNYFHPKSMRFLLENCGFEVLEIKTPGKLDAELVRKKALAGVITLDDQPFLKRILLDEWQSYMESFQQWLSDNELSSHMWVVAKKK